MMDTLLSLLALFLLLLLKGFFSGSEIALVNADKLKLRHRARQGHGGAKLVLRLFERPERLLATTLVGTNICTVTLATSATLMAIGVLPEGGDLFAYAVITPIMLIFGEVVPKSVYQQKADDLAPVIIYPLQFFSWLFFPVVLLFSWFARLVVRLVSRKKPGQGVFVARAKLRTLLDAVERVPSSEIFDHERIKRAIRFSDITAVDAMIPIGDAVVINAGQGLGEAIAVARSHGYNRLPVFDAQAGRVAGILVLSTWDLLDPDLASRAFGDFLHPATFVAPSHPVEQLLPALQSGVEHMCIVVDEYGSAIGLVTVEDILEEVVGEIEDVDFRLHGPHGHVIQELEGGAILVDAHLSVADLNDRLDLEIPSIEFRTVGGLLVTTLQHIPAPGESAVEAGMRFTAVEVGERMVKTVRVERLGD